MKLAIMQPYVFPYIGYFQLINHVDQFVIYDDVQYINRGWINRNRILVNGQAKYFTLPVKKADRSLPINQRELADEFGSQKDSILRQIDTAYNKAPYYADVATLIKECFDFPEKNVALFVANSIRQFCQFLDIDTRFVVSSELQKPSGLKGEDHILEINKILGSTNYINPIGGTELYDHDRFAENGISLQFLETRGIEYPQFPKFEFVPFLSIIDVLMFNDKTKISELLGEFDLI